MKYDVYEGSEAQFRAGEGKCMAAFVSKSAIQGRYPAEASSLLKGEKVAILGTPPVYRWLEEH